MWPSAWREAQRKSLGIEGREAPMLAHAEIERIAMSRACYSS